MSDKKLTYNELVIPQHREALEKGRHRRIQVPIFFSVGDLMDLFKVTAKDVLSATAAGKSAQPVTAEQIALIDPKLRKPLFESPAKDTFATCLTSNTLLHTFAFLGAASCEERRIDINAKRVGEDGSMIEEGRISGVMESGFFRAHKDKPLEGAKLFFRDVWDSLERPTRTTLVATIYPAAGMN